ncbi:hypothetical protein GQ600_8431 [Phytophthora cactorum]|nr:hypothetical protein GQ600_8431 [Phytophthora cactorum]
MGGGNGQKSATKRDRNNAKKMKEAKQKNHAESKAKMEATKPASSRDRNNAKKMKDMKNKNHAESKAKMEADRTGLKCKICMTTFLITASVRHLDHVNRYKATVAYMYFVLTYSSCFSCLQKSQLNDHYQSKHESKGFTLEQCFPGQA